MPRRTLPAALVLAAAVADGGGLHLVAFYLVVVAVPAAAAAALTVFGELVQRPPGARLAACVQSLLGALGLAAVIVAASARANAVDGDGVPPLAASALVACLAAFALQGLVALLAPLHAERAGRVRKAAGRLRPSPGR